MVPEALVPVSTQLWASHVLNVIFFQLHLSLSLGSGGEESDKEKQEMIAIHSVNLLLKSIGATLTDVDDLIFK